MLPLWHYKFKQIKVQNSHEGTNPLLTRVGGVEISIGKD
jgi:Fe2+ transport system protein FeoA